MDFDLSRRDLWLLVIPLVLLIHSFLSQTRVKNDPSLKHYEIRITIGHKFLSLIACLTAVMICWHKLTVQHVIPTFSYMYALTMGLSAVIAGWHEHRLRHMSEVSTSSSGGSGDPRST